jgi:hypothetical protein
LLSYVRHSHIRNGKRIVLGKCDIFSVASKIEMVDQFKNFTTSFSTNLIELNECVFQTNGLTKQKKTFLTNNEISLCGALSAIMGIFIYISFVVP